jgi:hypothetical protein|tara:strand:- start:100 stop:276 length:177 start_codon:yes stop_codon:yes gene_type:complete
VHSAFDVGFDRAKTIGRSFASLILSMTSRVKSWGWPDTPMSTVGRRVRTADRTSGAGA